MERNSFPLQTPINSPNGIKLQGQEKQKILLSLDQQLKRLEGQLKTTSGQLEDINIQHQESVHLTQKIIKNSSTNKYKPNLKSNIHKTSSPSSIPKISIRLFGHNVDMSSTLYTLTTDEKLDTLDEDSLEKKTPNTKLKTIVIPAIDNLAFKKPLTLPPKKKILLDRVPVEVDPNSKKRVYDLTQIINPDTNNNINNNNNNSNSIKRDEDTRKYPYASLYDKYKRI